MGRGNTIDITLIGKDMATKVISGAKNSVKKAGAVMTKAFDVAALAAVAMAAGVAAALGKVTKDFLSMAESTGQIQAQLGLAEAPAQELANISENIFFDNVGADINTINQALIETRRQTGLEGQELEQLTKKSLMFNETFGTQTPEVMNAVNSLMENFGLSSDQAFDFVAGGFQKGLNNSGDFLDTIGEYSVQFADAGADADFFFNTLDTGLQAGVLGTDKIGDSFKEFTNEMLKGTDKARGGLEVLGMDADQMFSDLQKGNITGAEAFDKVIQKLKETDGMFEKNTAGTELLGTMYEDLTGKAVDGLSTTGVSVSELGEKTQHIEDGQKTLGKAIRGVYRDGLKAIKPFADEVEKFLIEGIENAKVFFQNFDANKIKELIPESVIENVEKFRKEFNRLTKFLTDNSTEINDTLKETFEVRLEGIMDVAAPIIDFLVGTFKIFTDFIINNWPTINQMIQKFNEIAGFVFNQLAIILNQFLIPVFEDLRDMFMRVAQIIIDNWPAISQLIDNGKVIIQFALSILVKWWGILWNIVKFAINNVIIPVVSTLVPFILMVVNKIAGFIANNLIPWLQEHIPRAVAFLKEKWNQIKTIFNFLREKYFEHVHPIVLKIINWFKEKVPKAIATLKEKWKTIQEIFKKLRDKYNTDVAPKVEAIKKFFQDKIPGAIETLKEKWNDLTKLFGDLKEKYDNTAGKVLGTIKTAFDNIKKVIDDTIGRIGDLIEKIENIPSPGDIKDGVGNFIGNLNPLDGKATGGSFPSRPFIAGEAGAELIDPQKKRVYNTTQTEQKLDDKPVSQNITINVNGSNSNPVQIAKEIRKELSRMNENSKYGLAGMR
jgi:phage-related minor tail protein